LRHVLDERCRARFAEDLARQLAMLLTQASTQEKAGAHGEACAQGEAGAPGGMDTPEEAIRALRRLELAGRRLGGGEHYDRMLRAAIRQIVSGPGSAVERARLVEILAGPDAALPLLQA
jgi:hypothetical protein